MELDELKQQLKQKLNETSTPKTDVDFASLLTKKRTSVLHKLKRSLLIELWICVAFTLLFTYIGLFNKHHSIRVYFSVFSVVCLLFFIVLVLLYKRVQKNNIPELTVKDNLVCIHSIIKEYTKRNFQLTMAMLPVCLLFAGYLGYEDGKTAIANGTDDFSRFHSFFTSSKQVIIFSVIYIVALTVGTYYFTKWYLQKLYGTYLVELQICIKELE